MSLRLSNSTEVIFTPPSFEEWPLNAINLVKTYCRISDKEMKVIMKICAPKETMKNSTLPCSLRETLQTTF